MRSIFKYYFTVVMFVLVLLGIVKGSAFGFPMTIDAIDDAGQSPNQEAYLKFVYPSGELPITTAMVPNQWTSSSDVYSYATSHSIPVGWHLESGGNIWSSDKIVGDTLNNLNEGIYRVSVVSGAFMYDSFDEGWSPFENQWRWELHIQALRALVDGEIKDYFDYMLGSFDPYSTADLALQASLGKYIDVPLAEGGSLIFWIWDNPYTIDNSRSVTFSVSNVTPVIPEPSTLILVGTGLLFLVRRFRKSLIPLN